MILRDATPNDIPALLRLITELGYPSTAEQMIGRLATLSAHPDYRVLLANNQMEAVGLIGLSKNWSLEHDGCFVRIIALVVSQSARHQGIGDQLIRAAERWAIDMGATRLVLNSGNRPERVAAHQFYPKMGFESRTTTVYSKRIPESINNNE